MESGDDMLRGLAIAAVLLTTADHWTTYLCLRGPVNGWRVSEANPVADWLFQLTGLVPGLAIDSAITLLAVAFLLSTAALSDRTRLVFLAFITASTAYAVINNVQAIRAMGISPLGLV
jgi:hypothetical protein